MAANPGVFGDYAVVATGYNYPYWDPPRFDRSIDGIIRAFEEAGVKRIFWVTMREIKPAVHHRSGRWNQVQPYYWYFPTVNDHLRAAVARHPNLSLIDWASIADQPGLTYDAIHLNTIGAANTPPTSPGWSCRRPRGWRPGRRTTVMVAGVGGVPADANGRLVEPHRDHPRTPGFLTAYPCGEQRPVASNVNSPATTRSPAPPSCRSASDGTVCVFQPATHLSST